MTEEVSFMISVGKTGLDYEIIQRNSWETGFNSLFPLTINPIFPILPFDAIFPLYSFDEIYKLLSPVGFTH